MLVTVISPVKVFGPLKEISEFAELPVKPAPFTVKFASPAISLVITAAVTPLATMMPPAPSVIGPPLIVAFALNVIEEHVTPSAPTT